MSLTQLDATHMRCEMATRATENEQEAAAPSSEMGRAHMAGESTSLRINKSFNYAVSYVTAFLLNVVPLTDLLMWRRIAGFIPSVPHSATSPPPPDARARGIERDDLGVEETERSTAFEAFPRAPETAAKHFGEDQELILRLGGRKPAWFPIKQLETDYGNRLHVQAIIRRLSVLDVLRDPDSVENVETMKRGSNPHADGGDGKDETFDLLVSNQHRSYVEVIDGTQLAQLLLAGEASTRGSVRNSSGPSADAALPAPSRKRQRNSSGHTASVPPVVTLDATLETVLQCTRRRHLREVAIQLKKILQSQAERSAQESDRLDERAKHVEGSKMLETIPQNKIQLVQYLVHYGKKNSDAFGGCWDVVVGPMCRLHPAVKQTLRSLFTMFNVLTYNFGVGSSLTSFQGNQPPMPPSTLLVLHALRFVRLPMYDRMPLFIDLNAIENSSRSIEGFSCTPLLFLTNAHYHEYLHACAVHEDMFNAATNPLLMRRDLSYTRSCESMVADALRRLKLHEKEARQHWQHTSSEGSRPSVYSLLREKGMVYQHLLAFLPKYRWMACVEYLIPMLISNKQWDDANKWLRYLLNEPVLTLSVPGTAAAFEFCYRYQKRGEWWHRLALNLVQQKLHNEAYSVLEEQLQPIPGETEVLPPSAQRRMRLLRALWAKDIAEMNLRKDLMQRRFCRRSDRLALEQLLIRLHQPPRRWAPLSLPLLSSALHKPRIISLHALRDTEDSTRWCDVRRRLAPRRVEDFVLQWFKDGRGRKEANWDGAHCEGKWISLLAKIILRDAYYNLESPEPEHPYADPKHGLPWEMRSVSTGEDAVWLSPFQEAPLDLITTDGFVSRRYSKITSILAYIESCSREEFIQYIRTRLTWKSAEGEEMLEVSTRLLHDSAVDAAATNPIAGETNPSEKKNADESENESDIDEVEHARVEGEKTALLCSFPHASSGHGAVLVVEDATRFVDSSTETLVDVGDFPLLAVAECVPLKPLCDLIRRLYLSPMSDGYTIKFSGFPDLVLWNASRSEPQFKLIEVKSPNDTLSTKQNAILDTLLSCGFDAAIAHIIESRPLNSPRSSSGTAQEPTRDGSLSTRTTERRLSGQIRVPGEPARNRRLSTCLQGSSAYNPVTL